MDSKQFKKYVCKLFSTTNPHKNSIVNIVSGKEKSPESASNLIPY